MFTTISNVLESINGLNQKTLQVIETITDESLKQEITPGNRNLGRILWHIVQTVPEMMGKTGLPFSSEVLQMAPPTNVSAILNVYKSVYSELHENIKSEWTDETLKVKDDMYGEKWAREKTINALIAHETHHLGQITVLMRQAGLKPPGIYGPAKEEWSQFGRNAPII